MNAIYPALAAEIRDRIAARMVHFREYDELHHAELTLADAEAYVRAAKNAVFDREWQYLEHGKKPKEQI